MMEKIASTVASMFGTFSEDECREVLVASRLAAAEGGEAVRKAVDYLKALQQHSYSTDKATACRLVAKGMEDALQNPRNLDRTARVTLRNAFIVASLGLVQIETVLVDCYAEFCHHLLLLGADEVIEAFRSVALNEEIKNAAINGLTIMVYSADREWMFYRKQPANHLVALNRILVLEMMSAALGPMKGKPPLLVMCMQWMDTAKNTSFSKQQASAYDVVSNGCMILKVAAACRSFNGSESETFLISFLQYLQHMNSQQHPMGYLGALRQPHSERVTELTTHVIKHLFRFFSSKEVLLVLNSGSAAVSAMNVGDAITKLFIAASAFPDTIKLVCNFVLELEKHEILLADALFEAVVNRIMSSTTDKLNQKKGWQELRSLSLREVHNTSFSGRMKTIILQALNRSNDESIIDCIPADFVVTIFAGSEQRTTYMSAFLKRYFENVGGLIFNFCSMPGKTELTPPLLLDCDKMLDKVFAISGERLKDSSMTEVVKKYIEPVQSMITGIAKRAAQKNRTRYTDQYVSRDVAYCFAHVLVLLVNAKNYANGADAMEEHEERQLWDEVKAQFTSFLNGHSLQVALQDLLAAVVEGDVVRFLGSVEDSVQLNGLAISPLYVSLSTAVGEKLMQIDCVRPTSSFRQEVGAISFLLTRSINLLPSRSTVMCKISHSYVIAVFDFIVNQYMQRNRFVPPKSLVDIPAAFLAIERNGDNYCKDLLKYQKRFEDAVTSMLFAVQDMQLTLKDVQAAEGQANEIMLIARAFKIEMSEDMLSMETISSAFLALDKETEELINVITFLNNRKLCPNYASWRTRLAQNASDIIPLCQLQQSTVDIVTEMELDPEGVVLLALRSFSRDSDLFADRFDHIEAPVQLLEQDVNEIIALKTTAALKELKLLVSDENIKISDFTVNLSGVIAELQGQGRRQKKMEKELQSIATFFSSCSVDGQQGWKHDSRKTGDALLTTNLNRLNAAFTLVKCRDVLPSFRMALKGLKLEHVIDPSSDLVLATIQDDFLVSHAPDMLTKLTACLGGMEIFELKIIGKLASERELSAGLLLMFFKRHQSQQDFDRVMEHAQNRAAGNAHVSRVLRNIPAVRDLLELFWKPSQDLTLHDIADHLRMRVHIGGKGQELVCACFEELTNLIEHWGECEIYFRDGVDANGDTGDIVRLVQLYQKSGQFVASCHASPGGASLAFCYSAASSSQNIILQPEVLQEHVQWAVLGGSETQMLSSSSVDGGEEDQRIGQAVLDEFVAAFDSAQRVHALRLQLELTGHPDYQATVLTGKYVPIADSCLDQELNMKLEELQNLKATWEMKVKQACDKCPRLCLLPQRARVHFLLTLRGFKAKDTVVASKLLPYVLQCFPQQLGQRALLYQYLLEAVNLCSFLAQAAKTMMQDHLDDLELAVGLLNNIETTLKLNSVAISLPEATVSRLELFDGHALTLYCHHLNDMISSTDGLPGVPCTVLWGSCKLEPESVQDFIAAVTSGVAAAAHVIDIDKMLPRAREELLRGLQSKPLKCPVLLLFGDQDGSDSFRHYPLEAAQQGDVSSARQRKLYASACWPTFNSKTRDAADTSAEVFVVAGAAGAGKSTWIDLDVKKRGVAGMDMTIVVHEGFDVAMVLDNYQQLIQDQWSGVSMSSLVVLRFDVTPFGDLSVLGRFLHHLLTLGLILDEKSGRSAALMPKTVLKVYVELPAVVTTDIHSGSETDWPPVEDSGWAAKDHPYLKQLPILAVIIPDDHYVSIRANMPFILDRRSRYVAACLHAYYQHNGLDAEAASLPSLGADPLDDNRCAASLEHFFRTHTISLPKRVRYTVLRLLYTRFKLLSIIQRRMRFEIEDEPVECYFLQFAGCISGMFELMITEAISMASASARHQECLVFSIMPNCSDADAQLIPPESQFEMLVFSQTSINKDLQHIVKLYPQAKVLITHEPISNARLAEIRALVAPAFGMVDTGFMIRNLIDAGHLLTPDSLSRVLHLHCRRSIRSNVIYEGETGCGKSQNLKLYSHLMNANAALFTNLKLHLLAIVQTATTHFLTAEGAAVVDDADAEDTAAYRKAAANILGLSAYCSIEELLQLVVAWIRLGEKKLANQVGIVIFAYFLVVFRAYPLYVQGINEVVAAMLDRFNSWIAINAEHSALLKRLAIQAANEPFLVDTGRLLMVADDEQGPLSGNCAGDASTQPGELQLFADESELEDFLYHLMNCKPASLYYRKLADEGLTPERWRAFLVEVSAAAERVRQLSRTAVVCVFVDESNTAGAFGMVTEAFVSHTADGKPIADNIFFVGAINPYRKASTSANPAMDFTASKIHVHQDHSIKSSIEHREEDEQQDYLANVPYIVKPLSANMRTFVQHYPNLDQHAEALFVREYFVMHVRVPAPAGVDRNYWTAAIQFETYLETAVFMILRAQDVVRSFGIPRVFMSIRNLIRVIQLLMWYLNFKVPTRASTSGHEMNIFLPRLENLEEYLSRYYHLRAAAEQMRKQMRQALIMAVTVTYMFQLPTEGHVIAGKAKYDYRKSFMQEIVQAWISDVGSTWNENRAVLSRPDLQRLRREEWQQVLRDSLEHLWSLAQIPKGLAKTNALMETFYTNILAAENKMGLLVTGPPGCGKTLSFNLACENLRGPCLQHTVAFQNLKKAAKFMYQCSATSTGPELSSRYSDAYAVQTDLDVRQPGKHICIVGVDEAGLTPENRQALKSLHDVLDERTIGTTMMSNTTLDAAKTSRMLQLLQTQANLVDLFQLAVGLLVDEDSKLRVPKTVYDAWVQHINGLCQAFFTIGEVIQYNNWFHSRDFVYMCRYLRRLISQHPPISTLFDTSMLLEALRRHFQPVVPEQFPALALHFLDHCGLYQDADLDISANVVESLKQSLQDTVDENADATAAHCRYTMIIDPTDSEAAIDLLFAMKLLDHSFTNVVSLSDFPEDATPTRQTAVLAQIKHAIETGACLLLKNSAPLQSALYDVINRHYAISVHADPLNEGKVIREAYANIAMGSFSRYVKIHPNFRLVVHIPQSQLPMTPLPFLNRMEKYPFSVRNALAQRVQEIALNPPPCLRSIPTMEHFKALFAAIEAGVEDFINFAGGSASFYGFPPSEAVPALLLRALADSELNSLQHFDPRPTVLATVLNENNALVAAHHIESQDGLDEDDMQHYDEQGLADFMVADELNPISSLPFLASEQASATGEVMHRMRGLIRSLNFQVLETARVECIFRLRNRLPATYLKEYIDRQEHFSVVALLGKLIICLDDKRRESLQAALKLVIYTRTDGLVLRIGSDQDPNFAQACLIDPIQQEMKAKVRTFVLSSGDQAMLDEVKSYDGIGVCLLQLSAFQNGISCEQAIRASMSTLNGPRLLLVVADMKICSTNQVTFCRVAVDKELSQQTQPNALDSQVILPMVTFLLHVPADQLQLRSCYQTIPLNNWSAVYVDSFSASDGFATTSAVDKHVADYDPLVGVAEMKQEEGELQQQEQQRTDSLLGGQVLQWMRVAFCLASTPSLADVNREFSYLSSVALEEAVKACVFTQMPRNRISGHIVPAAQYFKTIGLERSLLAYRGNDKAWIIEMLGQRSYIIQTLLDSFSIVWGRLLESTVQQACDRLGKGATTAGLVTCVRSTHKWLLSDFMRLIVRRDLASGWGLEALARLSNDATAVGQQWQDVVKREEQVGEGSTALCLILLTVHLLRASILSLNLGNTNRITSAYDSVAPTVEKVDCQSVDHAPLVPLYHVLNRLIKTAMPKAVTMSRSQKQGLLASDRETLRNKLGSLVGTDELPRALVIIEQNPDIWKMWQQDFIKINLGCAFNSLAEIEILIKLAESFPSLQDALQTMLRYHHSAGIFQRDVCLWMLLEKPLKQHLAASSRLLIAHRGILSETTLQSLLASDDELDCAVLSQKIADASTANLWSQLNDLTTSKNYAILPQWMQHMRDQTASGGFDAKQLFATMNSNREAHSSFQYMIMFIVFKCVGVSTRSLQSLGLKFQGESNEGMSLSLDLQGLVVSLAHSDPMQSALLLLLSASRAMQKTEFQEVVVDVLRWMAESLELCRNIVLVAGLLGFSRGGGLPGDDLTKMILVEVFSCLTLSARSELLKKLLLMDRAVVEAELSLLLADCGDAHNEPQAIYVPSLVLSANSQYAQECFAIQNVPDDLPYFRFDTARQVDSANAEIILFRTFRLLHLLDESSGNLHHTAKAFNDVNNAAHQGRGGGGRLLFSVQKAVVAVHLLELTAECFSLQSDGPRQAFMALISNDRTVHEIATAIAIAPRAMSLFLFSQLKDIAVATSVLQDTVLLTRLRIPWWQSPLQPKMEDDKQLTEAEMTNYNAVSRANRAKFACIHIASALVTKAKQLQQWQLPTLPQLLSTGVGLQDDPLSIKCADMVKMMLDLERRVSLAANIHIPNILTMHQFVQEKFSFRLRDEAEVRSLLIEKALALLPMSEQLEGRRVFKKFLDSWEVLRRLFVTFNICGREVQAAAEIPPLTDEKGERPTFLADIVELSGADEHESMPVRMLEQRLIKQINELLANEMLVSLRADDNLNSLQHLTDDEVSEVLLSKLVVDSTGLNPFGILLTGSAGCTNSPATSKIDDFIMCHVDWHCSSGEMIVPTALETGPTVDFAAAIQQSRERIAREAQLAAHTAGLILCPNCGMLNEHNGGCEHMTCGSPTDAYGTVTAHTKTMGAFGCGFKLHRYTHQIPAPVHGVPVIAHFQPHVSHLPAGLVNATLPALPQLAPSTGYHVVNFVAIAKHILAHIVHQRVKIKVDDSFFAPLPLQAKLDNDKQQEKVPSASSERAIASTLDEGILPAVHVADVFVRLRIAADHVTAAFSKHSSTMVASLAVADVQKLKRFIARFDENRLRIFCEQLLQLCAAVLLKVIHDGQHLEEAFVFITCDHMMDIAAVTLKETEASFKWDAVLHRELASSGFTLACLAEIAHIFAMAGMEGACLSVHATFKTEIPANEEICHEKLRDDLQQFVDDALLTAHQEELQTLGSLLAASEGDLLKTKDRSMLRESKALGPYLADPGHALSAQVVGKLYVCHLGALMRFIRQLVGLISYCKLSRRYQPQQSEAAVHGDVAGELVYSELVPEEWIAFQDLAIGPDGEFTMTAAALLKQRQQEQQTHAMEVDDQVEENHPASMDESAWMTVGEADWEMPSAGDDDELHAVPSTLGMGQIQSIRHLLYKDAVLAVPSNVGTTEGKETKDLDVGDEDREYEDDFEEVEKADKDVIDQLPKLPDESTAGAMPPQPPPPEELIRSSGAQEVSGRDIGPVAAIPLVTAAVAAVPVAAKTFPKAWKVLTKWRTSLPALEEVISESLGIEEENDLVHCETADVQAMALTLPRIPQRKLLHAMAQSDPALWSGTLLQLVNAQAAYAVLVAPTSPEAVRGELTKFGLVPDGEQLEAADPSDLAFLDEEEIVGLLAHFTQPIKRRKLRAQLLASSE